MSQNDKRPIVHRILLLQPLLLNLQPQFKKFTNTLLKSKGYIFFHFFSSYVARFMHVCSFSLCLPTYKVLCWRFPLSSVLLQVIFCSYVLYSGVVLCAMCFWQIYAGFLFFLSKRFFVACFLAAWDVVSFLFYFPRAILLFKYFSPCYMGCCLLIFVSPCFCSWYQCFTLLLHGCCLSEFFPPANSIVFLVVLGA